MDRDSSPRAEEGVGLPRPNRLAWLPIPLLLTAMVMQWITRGKASYEFPHLLLVLNFAFSLLTSLFIACLIGRSFVVRGTPGLLWLGCGVLAWGLAGFVGSATAPLDANVQVTIHGLGVWLAAACQLTGTVLLARPRRALRAAGLWLAAGYLLAVGVLGVIALSALGQWTSAFFLPGQGGTPLRQFVLSSGMAMFGLTAAVLWGTGRRPLSAFTYWYGLALALMAAGLFGAMIPSAQYSLLDWTGRATQFLGGVYMVIAAIASVRETRVWGLPLEAALRESEARFRIMADGSPILIWVTDAHGGVQFINRTYREFFGVTYEYVQGNLWQPLIHPEDTAAYTGAFLDAVRQRRPFKAEARVRRADGQWRWIDSHAEPHWSLTGEFLGHIGASPDITERKGAEEKLRELNATLECKVGQRTAELERRARQLQKLTLELSQAEDRERQRVAAILHEDLQQQIAGAKFHLGLLKNRTRNSRAQREVVDRVDEMLRDAIEKSRSLSHDLSPPVTQANDLAEALQWLAHRVRAQHGLTVRVGVLGAVPLQAEALTMFLFRAAQELLFNVVKHAQVKEAAVRVRRMGRCVYLSVADRGCGFDPQELRETSGFGLLSIRERVELLGGRMKIRSAKGQGSRFRIVLPDERKIQATRHQVEEGKQRTTDRFASSVLRSTSCDRALRLLLADDHEIVREGLVSLLKEVPGIEVVGEAANGREAVHLADELRPDVVAMDVSMPVMGGEEAARLIKRRLPATRIVALSMHEEIEAMDRMHQAGAESYVLKTAPSEDLLAAIRGCRPA